MSQVLEVSKANDYNFGPNYPFCFVFVDHKDNYEKNRQLFQILKINYSMKISSRCSCISMGHGPAAAYITT